MLDAPSMTLRILALTLCFIGSIGNLGVAAWYIWKKKELKRGFLHVVISVMVFLPLCSVMT